MHRGHPLTPIGDATLRSRALDLLRSYLPTSLPLYRRLQFGRFFEDSVLFFASAHIRSDKDESLDDAIVKSHDKPWMLAFVDRTCRPETEAYFFGSWEASPPPSDDTAHWQTIQQLLSDFVQACKRLKVPKSLHQDVLDAQAAQLQQPNDTDSVGYSRADFGGHAANTNIMLWGAIHQNTAGVLDRLGILATEYKSGMVPNHTFVFDVASLAPATPLPEGLRWGVVVPEHFPLIKSRTQIPRQDRTMAVLQSLAIYPTGPDEGSAPVAWAFVGLDGSLTTLHVEAEWRGKGLAKAISTKLFKDKMSNFWENGEKQLAHGYVIAGNKPSEATCRSLGAKREWECYWLRVDLSKV